MSVLSAFSVFVWWVVLLVVSEATPPFTPPKPTPTPPSLSVIKSLFAQTPSDFFRSRGRNGRALETAAVDLSVDLGGMLVNHGEGENKTRLNNKNQPGLFVQPAKARDSGDSWARLQLWELTGDWTGGVCAEGHVVWKN